MERRHLSLMFTDIVGYSRLMGQNEAQCITMVGEYRRILLAQIEKHQGTVIEFIGDAVFARFDTPLAAVQAGIAIQKDLGRYNEEKDPVLPKLQSRIGIHSGDVTLKDDALFGDDVNIAARLEPIAVADGLCISEGVYKAVKHELHEPVLSLGTQPLKNIESKKIKAYLVRPAGITLGTHGHYWLRKTQQKIEHYRYPISACIVALIVAGFYYIPRWLVPGYTANYVEIADFKNLMSEDGSPDYFSAGITEALRSQLADIRNIYILEADKGVRGPVRLEGSVQKIDEHLRIAYRLFRRKDNVQIAGGKLDGAYKDIFILQDRVVAEIAGYLAKEFNIRKFRPAAPKLTSDVTAYDYYLQGLEYLRKPRSHENYDAAIKLFSTALVHDNQFAQANAGLCSAYRGKFILTKTSNFVETAEDYCVLALEQNDNLAEAYESLGIIYRDTGREDQAIEILNKALEIDPDSIETQLALAKVYSVKNADETAERLFKEVIAAHPDSWSALYQLANYYTSKGQLDLAIKGYKEALLITPENEYLFSNLGVAYFYKGDYENAADAFAEALVYSPSSWAYSNTGTMYYFAGNFSEAKKMFREAIKLAPDDYRWYVNYADALRQMKGDTQEVKFHYQKAVELGVSASKVNENDASLYHYLALSYIQLDEIELAKDSLKKAIELAPTDVNTLYVKARVYSATSDVDSVVEVLKQLIGSGYSPTLVKADPDFNNLSESKKFQDIFIANNE